MHAFVVFVFLVSVGVGRLLRLSAACTSGVVDPATTDRMGRAWGQLARWGCFGVLILLPVAGKAQEPESLTIAELRAMPRERLQRNPLVRLRGIVAAGGLGIGSGARTDGVSAFFLEDETGGVWIEGRIALERKRFLSEREVLTKLENGTEIELIGEANEGWYAPNVVPLSVSTFGKKPLPTPVFLDLASITAGQGNGRRVTVNGVVQGCVKQNQTWLYRIGAATGFIYVSLPMNFDPETMVDAEVQISGVAGAIRNLRREIVQARLIPGVKEDLVITHPPRTAPFLCPKVPINQIAVFSQQGLSLHRQRVEGTVTYVDAIEGVLYLQEGECGLRVESAQASEVSVGERVEVAGFVDRSHAIAGLTGGVLRKIGAGSHIEPKPVTLSSMVETIKTMKDTATRPRDYEYDGALLQISGRLIGVHHSSVDAIHIVEVQGKDGISSATLRGDCGNLRLGSDVQVTGVSRLEYQVGLPYFNALVLPTRVNLLLRDSNDIVVLRAASWWTKERLEAVLVGVGIAAVAALVWAFSLRTALAKRGAELLQEMRLRRDAVVEFDAALRERSRLAANLHDTVLQTMTGLAHQIMACEIRSGGSGGELAKQLGVARRMAQRGQDDLRNAVWALRAMPLQENSLSEAVQAAAQLVAVGYEIELEVQCAEDLPKIPDFVAGNLLLLMQEAIHNALKHAMATRIVVKLEYREAQQELSLSVRDNGVGFMVGTEPSFKEGHFGLIGMRERADRLKGKLEVASQPNEGTCISVTLPIYSFDHDLV